MQNDEKYTALPYPWPEFKRQWKARQLSVEQVIEQLMIWGEWQHEQLMKSARTLEEQAGTIADLAAQMAAGKDGNVEDNVGEE